MCEALTTVMFYKKCSFLEFFLEILIINVYGLKNWKKFEKVTPKKV